jgi:dTDP-4-amino-4,6-dideoxygalactose transaminase
MVPYLELSAATHELRPELDEAVARVLESGIYIQGSEVEAFETEFAAYCGARHCIGVGNGFDALMLTMRAMGIGPGDEVIVPSNTYIATWLAVTATGATVAPVEPQLATYNLDPERVEEAITPNTKAILAVHLYGQEADTPALGWIAEKYGLPLIVDSAQGHGIRFGGHTQAFSFYPTKNLGALGDAGAVVTNDGRLAERIRLLGNYGSRRKYHHELAGFNSRLDPIQAAVLRVKLRHLRSWNERRRYIALRYLEDLAGIPGLILPNVDDNTQSVWHVFPVRHPDRDALARQLKDAGVGTLVHYPIPPHLSGAYRLAGYRRGDFPIAEEIADTELSLPLHTHMTTEQIEEVIGTVCIAACLPFAAGQQRAASIR